MSKKQKKSISVEDIKLTCFVNEQHFVEANVSDLLIGIEIEINLILEEEALDWAERERNGVEGWHRYQARRELKR